MGFAGETLERLIESQVFFPDPYLVGTPAHFGLSYEDKWFDTSDGIRLHGWFVPASGHKGVLLFCHGNAGNISHRLDNIWRLQQRGLSVFIFDYRGYGRSSGQITEKGFFLDAEAAYQVACDLSKGAGVRLVVFGRSLGGIAAVHVGSGMECSGVILESTFTNLGDMASVFFPVPFVGKGLAGRLNAIGKIDRVRCPMLFFHGDCDEIVPLRLGRALFDAAKSSKEFVTLRGATHNDTYMVGGEPYFEKFIGFIEALPEPGVNSPGIV